MNAEPSHFQCWYLMHRDIPERVNDFETHDGGI